MESKAGIDWRVANGQIPYPDALAHMEAPILKGKKLVIVSILRAGNGLLEGMLDLVPSARVAHVGIYRNPQTLEPVEYYLAYTIQQIQLQVPHSVQAAHLSAFIFTPYRAYYENTLRRAGNWQWACNACSHYG